MKKTDDRPASGSEHRPAVRRGLHVLQRDDLTLQFGLDPERRSAWQAPSAEVVRLVRHLDGRSDVATLARRHGLSRDLVGRVVADLGGAGLLEGTGAPQPADAGDPPGLPGRGDRAESSGRGHRPGPPLPGPRRLALVRPGPTPTSRQDRRRRDALDEEVRRTAPDRAAWDLLEDAPGAGSTEVGRRAAATVAVTGSGRLATALTLLLGSAGVGTLVVPEDPTPARTGDRTAGGLGRDDVGRSRRSGVRRRLAEVAPAARLVSTGPAAVVVVTDSGADRAAVGALHTGGLVHLVAGIEETVGRVGPFVVPGRTSCLTCQDLHRSDRDPRWALVRDQLAVAATGSTRVADVPAGDGPAVGSAGAAAGGGSGRAGSRPASARLRAAVVGGPAVPATDNLLTTLVAATAALHVLTWLRGEVPPSVDATVEARLPDGSPRRRGWTPHPRCGCLAPGGPVDR